MKFARGFGALAADRTTVVIRSRDWVERLRNFTDEVLNQSARGGNSQGDAGPVRAGEEHDMTQRSELVDRHRRLQRKLAAVRPGWHSGRVDQLEEALRSIEQEIDKGRAAELGARAVPRPH